MNAAYRKKKWVRIGYMDDILPGTGKTVLVMEQQLAIFHLYDGTMRAVENRCPHQDGVLAEGIVSGEYIFCPMHERKINLETGMVQLPDTGCIKTYPVQVGNDGSILVEI